MDARDEPAATIHPGAVEAIFDHLILAMTADGEPGPPGFLYSHYRFRWAVDAVVGELAFVELDRGAGQERLVVTDEPALAAARAARLSPRDWLPKDTNGAPVVARFEAGPFARSTVTETVTADALRIEVEWGRLALPIMAMGPAPRVPSQDIVSVLIEAGSGRATIDGRPVPGALFRNDIWRSWLGRPLRSGVVAIGEVLLTRP